MSQRTRWVGGILLFLFIVGAPVVYARYRKTTFRNFHAVGAGKVYRSGQLTIAGLQRAIHDYGIKTVITLRDAKEPGGPEPDAAEEEFCGREEVYYYRLPHRALHRVRSPWEKHDGKADVDPNVAKFLQVLDDPKHYPVLIHCTAGINRTGAYVAIYRMEYDRWTNNEALDEVRAYGYDDIDEHTDILEYLQTYVPRWKR